ncbi:MAG: anti-sigma factor domain-containing protein, partial [Polyangiaceae bacterium]
AAACFAVAASSLVWSFTRAPEVRVVTLPAPSVTPSATQMVTPAPTLAQQRAEVASAKDAVHVDWQATKDPASKGASGDVVWSASLQKGYMRFVGLAPNDKTVGQYQLWIFDKDRDARYPVDGGVFDVASNGEVLVPIASKLRVDDATLFAVTFEKPGGVVVSKRERMIVTAAPKSG